MKYTLIYQNLLSIIDNSTLHNNISKSLDKIYKNKELLSLIEKYKITKNNNIRNQIYENKDFKEYKKLENETNLLKIKLNKIFKELRKDYESN